MTKANPHFTPGVFQFLAQLKKHNDRDWFQVNKERYESEVRDPFLRFIADLGPGIAKINPNITVDPSPSRGSMMRVYRDIRFSEDKTPYRTFLGARFMHESGTEAGMPTFYLHLGVTQAYMAAGIWRPDTRALKQIRDRIADQPAQWKKVKSGIAKDRRFEWAGEFLTRPPRGFPVDHPLIEDIKRKDFAVRSFFAEGDVYRPDFLRLTLDRYRAAGPLVAFLSSAVGLA